MGNGAVLSSPSIGGTGRPGGWGPSDWPGRRCNAGRGTDPLNHGWLPAADIRRSGLCPKEELE